MKPNIPQIARGHRFPQRKFRGFSLVEVVMSLAIFSLVMVSSLSIFGVLLSDVSTVSQRDDAVGLTSALDNTLENVDLPTVYNWVKNGTTVYGYHYRGQITANEDGDPAPALATSDYTLTPALKASGDTNLTPELSARKGPLYQIVFNVSQANPVVSTNLPSDSTSYSEDILAVKASFYVVPNTSTLANTNLPPLHTITVTYRR